VANSVFLTSDYYIVFMNPNKHKKEWNAIKLIMTVIEINYCIFIDYESEYLEFHPVTKQEFKEYYYNPN